MMDAHSDEVMDAIEAREGWEDPPRDESLDERGTLTGGGRNAASNAC